MIALIFIGFYFFALAVFAIGLRRGLQKKAGSHISGYPTVSVIVCARDEERNIDRCLESLSKLEYPHTSLELIVVDDSSEDSTPYLLKKWSEKLPHLRILDLHGRERFAQGKVNALIQGIDAATGEFICITDADCTVSPCWVSNYVQWFSPGVGMVSSIAVLDSLAPFDAAQSCEMIQLLSMSMSAIDHGFSVSIIGNNLALRKEAYEEIGGYRAIPFSITEDIALFQAMWHSRWKVLFKGNDELLVQSKPPDSFRMWWRQKQRWVVGGKAIEWPGAVILALGYVGIAAIFIALCSSSPQQLLLTIGLKFLADLLILVPTMISLKQLRLLPFFPVYELYLTFYLICVPIQFFQKKVTWKGRDYKTT